MPRINNGHDKALNLAEEQSEDGWRPVMGRFWVAEAGVGCRGALQAKHRASPKPFQVGVGHIRWLGEYLEPEPEDRLGHRKETGLRSVG